MFLGESRKTHLVKVGSSRENVKTVQLAGPGYTVSPDIKNEHNPGDYDTFKVNVINAQLSVERTDERLGRHSGWGMTLELEARADPGLSRVQAFGRHTTCNSYGDPYCVQLAAVFAYHWGCESSMQLILCRVGLDYTASTWEVWSDVDAFPGNNAHQMEMLGRTELEACKRLCRECTYGAFVVYRGTAYFRRESTQSCRAKMVRTEEATLYLPTISLLIREFLGAPAAAVLCPEPAPIEVTTAVPSAHTRDLTALILHQSMLMFPTHAHPLYRKHEWDEGKGE